MQAGRSVGGSIAPDGEITASGNRRGGEDKLPRVSIVGETPAGDVDRTAAGIKKFNPVGERAAIVHRTRVLGHEFVQINQLCGRGGVGGAGCAVRGSTGFPVGGRIGVAERVDDFERTPAAVGGGWPARIILVIHRGDEIAQLVEERDAFTRIVKTAAKPADRVRAGVTRLPSIGIGV